MTAQEMRTIRAAAKQDISHRDRKDHKILFMDGRGFAYAGPQRDVKDLAVLNFSRATSALGDGDLKCSASPHDGSRR
jgi:hypothetical protein